VASSSLAGGSHADVAQQVARHLAKVKVAGSTPAVRSTSPPDHDQGGDIAVEAVLVLQRKGDRTPAGAGMALRIQPTAPTWAALSAARR
jgi:hypothetical protein